MPRLRILLPVALLLPVAVVVTSLWAVNREEAQAPDARRLADVTREVRAYTESLERTAGSDLQSWSSGPEPCEWTKMTMPKKAPWTYRASGHLLIEPADQPAVLDGIRRWWLRSGFEITTDRPFSDRIHGELAARDPVTGITTTLQPRKSPDIVVVHLGNACMSPALGEDPGYDGI